MKKKKFFASALAAVICGSVCACSLPASALWYGEQELEIPDGYTEVANLEGCYQQIGEDLTGLFTFDCYYTNFTKNHNSCNNGSDGNVLRDLCQLRSGDWR